MGIHSYTFFEALYAAIGLVWWILLRMMLHLLGLAALIVGSAFVLYLHRLYKT